MIFDALREIASKWLTEIKPLVDTAMLLHLPVTPHEVLPREQDLETMSDVSINFRLPHLITAIEDNASCVLLIDPKPGLVGLHEPRMFIECVPSDGSEVNYNDTPMDRACCEAVKQSSSERVYVVCAGKISSPAQRAGSWMALGELLWAVKGTIAEQHTNLADFNALPEAVMALMTRSALRNAMTAIEELIAWDRGDISTRR